MNFYIVTNAINALCALTIALIIFLKRGRKPIQITYALFCLLITMWAFSYFIWNIQTNRQESFQWLQNLEYPVCFIHTAFFHFTLIFCNKVNKYKKILLLGYVSSVLLATINAFNGFFDFSYVRNIYSFFYTPHASPLLSLLIFIQVFYVGFSFYIMAESIRTSSDLNKTRHKYFLAASIIGWSGGITNWFHFYDSTPIPPIGNPAVAFYLLSTFYLIFKHDLLKLNLVVKRTFVYTVLTLFISLIYALFVALSERLFQSYIGYSSFIGSVFAALTIALLFNPIKNIINKFLDKRFFGKSIEQLSEENILMRLQLQNQDRMKAVATLSAGMAHEIKNPLTAIKTFAEYLPQKYYDPEFRENFCRIVTDEVDRVNNIVKQLLEFSKPSEVDLKPVLISGLLEETLNLLNNNFLRYKIEISKNFDTYAMILADRNQLKQAFLNLFLNSIQSMPEGGKLSVTARAESNGQVKVTISDTGCGISEEQLAHVFDPFYTTKEDGTGLGLAIVHGIIEKHGGKIKMESTIGKGTMVNIFLKSQS